MRKYICVGCGAVCYSAAEQKACHMCDAKFKEVSMTGKKDAPDTENKKQGYLDELAAMQRRFAEIYNSAGLVRISRNAVHIIPDEFFRLFDKWDISECGEELLFRYEAMHDGVIFYCITTKEVQK